MADILPQNAVAVKAEATTPSVHGIARSLAQSFAFYGIANFGIRALNFLLIVVYAHYLRPYDYGIIYMAEIIAAFLAIFAGLSIDSSLERLYFQHNHDAEELHSYLGSVIRFGFFWMALFFAVVLLLGRSVQSRFSVHASVPFYPYIAMAITTAIASREFNIALPSIRFHGARDPMHCSHSFEPPSPQPAAYMELCCAVAVPPEC